ncbi:MAG: hypothetical protein EOP87_04715 [Verrucomicrobiaceae bacterium]|nr:MAG: hypothetical protein EOP87_04715 [Verrucomicrobiaceae bacterium]
MTPEPAASPEQPVPPANTVILRFDEDRDDRHQELEAEAHIVQAIPRKGEVVNIEHQFHAVKEVIHNYDAKGIEVHLGPSGETPEEAVEKTAKES